MRKSILVCDDEEGIRESLKLILEKDYDVIFANTGIEAVERLKKSPVDLVILDIKMPKMDGIETLKKLKEANPALKTIISSGYKSVEAAKAATDAGALDYIVKPFNKSDVLGAVKRLLVS